jgi:hypothetical protein
MQRRQMGVLMASDTRTNARTFLTGPERRLDLPLSYKILTRLRSVLKPFTQKDDFEWDLYNTYYRAEIACNKKFFTEDLSNIDFRFIDGRIFILGDCKPLNLSWRCVYESIYNLPAIKSCAEIGVGGGRFIANLRTILGPEVQFSAYDLSERQLLFFKEEYPEVYRKTKVRVLDLTREAIPVADKPHVVLASTVLMHIQRPEAYQLALQHLLDSAHRFVVLMDNWNTHDYFGDLTRLVDPQNLYLYDSGANTALIISLAGENLVAPYEPLISSDDLGRYFSDYKYASASRPASMAARV